MLRHLGGLVACLLAASACSGSGDAAPKHDGPTGTPAPAAAAAPSRTAAPLRPVQALRRLDLPALTVQLSGRARHTVTRQKVWGTAIMDRWETDWSGVVVVRDTHPVGWDLRSALRTEADSRSGTLGKVRTATVDGRPALTAPVSLVDDGIQQTRQVTTVACGDLLVYVWVRQGERERLDPRLRQVVPSLRLDHDCSGRA